jgi:CheY-like chemotaxis protein
MTSTPTALLIDDDSQLNYVLQRYAVSYGARLLAADFDGSVGALVEQEHPAVILLSLTDDDERSRSMLRALRSDPQTRAIPIVLCTTYEIDRHGWAAEADRVVVQPVMYADFAAILDQAARLTADTIDHPR